MMQEEYDFSQGVRGKYYIPPGEEIKIFIIYNEDVKATGTVYVDRMKEWDREKYYQCCDDNFGNDISARGDIWDTRDEKEINGFLTQYLGKPVKIAFMEKTINPSNGYPIYRIDYGIQE